MRFSEYLKKCRTEAGLSQAALAKKIGVSADSINAWEHESRRVSLEYADALCSALNTTFEIGKTRKRG